MKSRNWFPPGSKISTMLSIAQGSLHLLRHEGLASFVEKVWMRMKDTLKPPKVVLQQEIVPVKFPLFDNPEVSVVIPVFNKSLYTFNCLLSISQTDDGIEYEIIVVDNASTDNTPEMLALMENVRVIKNVQNLGFIEACNMGARAAKGKYIHFLNNDTVVVSGWLSALVSSFRNDPGAGAVGSKLIFPNYKLQETGGIVWKDASAWNYGKFDNADRPEYNYVREVDYCSGASLMVRKDLFEQIGGFDMRFAPAYWEDTDLCFAMRKIGYKVLFQPSSIIVHFEGVSAGRNTSSGMKRHQELNKPKFIEKWADELEKQCVYKPENVFLARDRNRNRKILVVDHHVPSYDRDAGSFFMFTLLQALRSSGYRVVFWPHNLYPDQPYSGILQQMGIEVIYNSVNFSKYMKRYGKFFDLAILTRTHIAIYYIDIVKKYIPRIIYHAPDLEYVREQRRGEFEKISARRLDKIKKREMYLLQNSDLITTVSPDEGDLISKEIPGAEVKIIPHPIEKITETKTDFENRRDLLFVGSMHTPNADAVLYFANEIMPGILEKLPDVKLYVVGSNPPKEVMKLGSENIIITGFVKDLLPYFEKCKVYIVPLRYGAGVKGKVIEAMSYGIPIVTTSVGAEGLNVSHGENIIIADSRDDFRESVGILYRDRALWSKIRKNALRHVEESFSKKVYFERVRGMMEKIFNMKRGKWPRT